MRTLVLMITACLSMFFSMNVYAALCTVRVNLDRCVYQPEHNMPYNVVIKVQETKNGQPIEQYLPVSGDSGAGGNLVRIFDFDCPAGTYYIAASWSQQNLAKPSIAANAFAARTINQRQALSTASTVIPATGNYTLRFSFPGDFSNAANKIPGCRLTK